MSWEDELITFYLLICKEYKESLWMSCERFTNGGCPLFSDEEVILVYLFGIKQGFLTLKSIHNYTTRHLSSYFPNLPKYAGFVHRVNQLSEAFRLLISRLQSSRVTDEDTSVYLVDSFPICLAHHQHAYTAKIAPELASKSYNSTKKMYYYGVKIHVVARKREGTLPEPEVIMLEEAARQDGPVFDQIRPYLHDNLVFADKAYNRPDAQPIELAQNLKVITPVTKAPGQKELDPEQKAYSKAVSRIRQPIETFFAWIQRITNIQNASTVRSTKGLLTHIFGKLAAALLFRNSANIRL